MNVLLVDLNRLVRRVWRSPIALSAGALVLLLLAVGAPARAASPNQTVPQPTPTADESDLPTPTPVLDDDENEEDETGGPAEEATPTPADSAGGVTDRGAAPPPAGEGEVTTLRLNVREGPGTQYGVIGTISSSTAISILGRNALNTWWLVCCVPGTETPGWVSAQFIQPSFDPAEAMTLLALADGTTPPPAASPTETAAVTATLAAPAPEPADRPLSLQMLQSPQTAAQGDEIEITFIVENPSAVPVTGVQLRNELPAELAYISAEVSDGGRLVRQPAGSGRPLLTIGWAELASGATVTAVVTVKIDAEVPNGAVIDTLAAVNADNAGAGSAGISIGMPPADALPDFSF